MIGLGSDKNYPVENGFLRKKTHRIIKGKTAARAHTFHLMVMGHGGPIYQAQLLRFRGLILQRESPQIETNLNHLIMISIAQ